MTCHIDPIIKAKIQRGEFVELERLLPKAKTGAMVEYEDESKMELVSKGGHTYFKPVKETHINGLRKWEQAFRVYAAVYTEANPECSGEVWQYMHCINIAATSYQWHNVAQYDVTFRQLMAYKPNRSWAKLYHQVWNLTMRDAIGNNSARALGQAASSQAGGEQQAKPKDWQERCCWKYNKNKCTRGKGCDWDHRCTYCGGWNHSYLNCRKCLGKQKKGDNRKKIS